MRPAPERYPLAVMAGIVVVSLLCLWGSSESYDLESAYRQRPSIPDRMTQFTRFEPVVSAVPEHAELGYLTDEHLRTTGGAIFLGAQYVLAPRLLERGLARELVLGVFSRPADFAAAGERRGLRLQQDFGYGVVLFRKEH